MKNFRIIILAVVLGIISNSAFSANFFTDINAVWNPSKSWTDNSTWIGNHPNPNNLNQDIIHIGNDSSNPPSHYVILNQNLTGRNGVQIHIYPNSTLEIIGDLTIQNNFVINVYNGGSFFLDGNVTINSGGGAGATLTINGNAEITGNLTGHGTITGTGTLAVGGTIDSNRITINPGSNDAVNVIGNDTTQYCTPLNVEGDVRFISDKFLVVITWDFDMTKCQPDFFEVKRTMNGVTVTFDPVLPLKSDLVSFEWIDNDDILNSTSEPVYQISAVYSNGVKSIPGIVNYENNPLPIELLLFDATLANNQININWATAAEINNDYFTLERSNDGNNWEIIGYVQGAGNANYVIRYNFTDMNPSEGVNYYRLKQTDFDGKFEYFAPVAIYYSSLSGTSEIVSTVARGQQLDIFLHNNDASAMLMISDINGRLVYNSNAPAGEYLQQVSIPLTRSFSGEVLIVKLVSGIKSDVAKIIVR